MHDYCAGCCFKTGASNNCPVHNQEYIRAEKELRADNRTHGFVDVDDDGNVDDRRALARAYASTTTQTLLQTGATKSAALPLADLVVQGVRNWYIMNMSGRAHVCVCCSAVKIIICHFEGKSIYDRAYSHEWICAHQRTNETTYVWTYQRIDLRTENFYVRARHTL